LVAVTRTIVVTTPRLDVRLWRPDEAAALHAILGDPVTMHAWPAPLELPAAQTWIEAGLDRFTRNGTARFALERREDGALIGDAGLVPTQVAGRDILDLGYIVHYPYWRLGFGFEAVSALVRYAFDTLHMPAVHAHMATDNVASYRLAEKLGMRPIDEFPHERDRGKTHRLYELRAGP
jgi:RimJ/RimL family protein N-acetyltransferase